MFSIFRFIILCVSDQLNLDICDPIGVAVLVFNALFNWNSTCNKSQMLSGQWIMLFKRWISMNPCTVYEMHFLECFETVQVVSIFLLDELR